MMQTVKLNNGLEMPILGYGVFQVTPEECERCVLDAIKVGYRSIDTAQAYQNEEQIGNAIRKCGIPRGEFFITTKVWVSNAGEVRATASIEESLRKLQTDYIDLLLIHQPWGDYYGTYRAMEKAYQTGKVRAIGISNFYPARFIDLAKHVDIKPAVNQVETHVFFQQNELKEIMQHYGTKIMSWGPLVEGKNNFFNNETLKAIGNQYHKSVAQTALKFLIQSGIIVIPKSTHIERMKENFEMFDFELSAQDMKHIRSIDTGKNIIFYNYTPEAVEYILNYKV